MTVTLANLYTYIRDAIGDEAEANVDQEYTNSSLNNYIARAVTRYSDFRPHVLLTTLLTVQGQYDYALPSDATGVRQVKWRNGPYIIAHNVTPTLRLEWKDNALIDVRNQIVSNFDALTQTSWAIVNNANSYMGGLFLRLFPAPLNSSEDVQVWYTTQHPLSGSSYATIQDDHIQHIVNLATALILRRKARLLLAQPDIAAGQGLRVGSKPAAELVKEANWLEQQTYDALAGTAVAGH